MQEHTPSLVKILHKRFRRIEQIRPPYPALLQNLDLHNHVPTPLSDRPKPIARVLRQHRAPPRARLDIENALRPLDAVEAEAVTDDDAPAAPNIPLEPVPRVARPGRDSDNDGAVGKTLDAAAADDDLAQRDACGARRVSEGALRGGVEDGYGAGADGVCDVRAEEAVYAARGVVAGARADVEEAQGAGGELYFESGRCGGGGEGSAGGAGGAQV